MMRTATIPDALVQPAMTYAARHGTTMTAPIGHELRAKDRHLTPETLRQAAQPAVTFLDYPEVGADNNGSERELRPTATYRKVTGGFRSKWGANFFAAVRSISGTAARRGIDAYQAIKMVLQGRSVLVPT
jgi:transposase IS66 family protein